MKFALILLALCGLTAAAEYKLDIRTPIERIRAQILVSRENPTDWAEVPGLIKEALGCLSGLIPSVKVVSDRVPEEMKQYIESISPLSVGTTLKNLDWEKVGAAGVKQEEGEAIWDDLKKFMNTTKFETIHEQIFGNEEFLDLLKFLHDSNIAEIYDAIKKFYADMGRPDLELPEGPSSLPIKGQHIRKRRSVPPPTPNFSPVFPLVELRGPITKAECGIGELLALLQKVTAIHLDEVLKILLYTAQEVVGNAGIHVLLLKLGEPQKGAFIHETLAMPEMEEFLPLAQGAVLAEPGVGQLNEILKQSVGLDVGNPELFKYILELVQYLVWNYPFPTS